MARLGLGEPNAARPTGSSRCTCGSSENEVIPKKCTSRPRIGRHPVELASPDSVQCSDGLGFRESFHGWTTTLSLLGHSAAAPSTWRNNGWTGSDRLARFASYLSDVAGRNRSSDFVQQALMRHADIGTTMNVYGDSVAESQRKANSKVVSLLLSKKTV